MFSRLLFLLALIGALLLTACTLPVSEPTADVGLAEQQFALGEYETAMKAYLLLAQQADSSEQSEWLLRASAAAARTDNLHQARQILKRAQPRPGIASQMFLLTLTEAHIALMERQPDEVLRLLESVPTADFRAAYLADYHDLRADAFTMSGNRLETARELVKRETYLPAQVELVQANQNDIWQALAMMPGRALQQLRTDPPPDVLSGWMELVQITKEYQLHPASLKQAVLIWRQNYPQHPVLPERLNDLQSRRQEDIAIPHKIALLLPLQGKFSKAAEAVRDGFLAAYYHRQTQTKQSVQVYNLSNSEDVMATYQQAVDEGANFIVGPLNKSHIRQLVESGDLPVPTLALNYIETEDVPVNLFQFGLSPEEEARQVAERTWLDGHVNAAVLSPTGPWGDRVYLAFKTRWQEVGGNVVQHQTYNAAKNDYSAAIRNLLSISDSRRRFRSMSHLLNQNLKFTPRRRQDIDFIFLAAYPRQARQIRPQLKFYHASGVPVYATSHVYTGNLNPERDRDMDGLVFGDMPWVLTGGTTHRGLRTEVAPYISKAGNRLQRLYALGIDSFNIIAALTPLRQYPYQRYDGETGSLSLDAKQRLHRQLTWVRFRSGNPRPLDEALQ